MCFIRGCFIESPHPFIMDGSHHAGMVSTLAVAMQFDLAARSLYGLGTQSDSSRIQRLHSDVLDKVIHTSFTGLSDAGRHGSLYERCSSLLLDTGRVSRDNSLHSCKQVASLLDSMAS